MLLPSEDMTLHQHGYQVPSILTSRSERKQDGAVDVREKVSVGSWSEAKGGMDRCCCQDLSAVTNGHCTDEASKTLENGDEVNHRACG